MSEQYYTREETYQETPAQALENFEAQSNSLANVVPEVAIALHQAGEAMGLLYNQAQEAGNTGAMALISASWQRTEQIANQAVQLDAARQAGVMAVQIINDERVRVSEMLDELTTAIYDEDETHPDLKDFAQAIRYDHEALMLEEAEEIASEWATEVVYNTLMDHIRAVTGCSWQQVNQFIGVLQGDYSISDLNAALLKDLIEHLQD